MNQVTPFVPAVGDAAPGNLYADLQSRTLWLGVDPAVDASGAVLVSDILALQATITAGDTADRAYTDTQILTRAPTSHTHTASNITDFNTAVAGIVGTMPSVAWITGMIVLWSGSLASIGVGSLAGWALCDGSNGTPDLRDRFIIGAGTKAPGLNSVGANMVTDSLGGHNHTGVTGAHTLTEAQMPAHAHWLGNAAGYGTGAGYTDSQGAHTHQTGDAILSGSQGGSGMRSLTTNNVNKGYSSSAGAHSHNVTVSSLNVIVNGATDNRGSSGGHTHTLGTDGVHSHTITAQKLRDAMPYFALAYIMKL